MPGNKKKGPGTPAGTNVTHGMSKLIEAKNDSKALLEEIYSNDVDKTYYKTHLESFESIKDLQVPLYVKQQLAIIATIIQKYDTYMFDTLAKEDKDFETLVSSFPYAKLMKDYRELIFKVLDKNTGKKDTSFLTDVKKVIADLPRDVKGKVTIEWSKDTKDQLSDIDCIDVTPVEEKKKKKKDDQDGNGLPEDSERL